MTNFSEDRKFEARYEPKVKIILADHFIKKDIQKDLTQGTDFLVYTIIPFKVAVRIRRNDCFTDQYRNEFTIRWCRPSGIDTEIHKIRKGLVDYILYGFLDQTEEDIIQWFIGDLKVFNSHNQKPLDVKPNNPPDSYLAIYNISQFPKQFIIAQHNLLCPANE